MKFGKIFWKKGGAEVIGFISATPLIILSFALLVSVIQLGSIKEQLEYITYQSCRRAIVVSDDDDDGDYLAEANAAAEEYALEKISLIKKADLDSLVVNVELVEDEDEEDPEWLKGNYARCTISVEVEAPLAIMSGVKTSSIVMMIERPASADGDYPWFSVLN